MLQVARIRPVSRRSFAVRRRFQLGGAIVLAALIPLLARIFYAPNTLAESHPWVAAAANAMAVTCAFWIRNSIETYPGIRSGAVILSSTTAGFGAVLAAMLMARLPYARTELMVGYGLTILWGYFCYFVAQRRSFLTIAVVPFGDIQRVQAIDGVFWLPLTVPAIESVTGCDAIVADFRADMPAEWERFLADAALAGHVIYHTKQLHESLTGRVEIEHLSENSFGSLIPAKGYFHLKSAVDWVIAALVVPLFLPVILLAMLAIMLEDGRPAVFTQRRVGHAGRTIRVHKLRTMRMTSAHADQDERLAAMTDAGDPRITRVGAFLRRTRIDELPQIFNILKGEMSWIGPRPEAAVLSSWYTGEIPFYRYRHVVKPGISGWAQTNQGHVADVDAVAEKLQLDFYYIKYFSPWLDLLIIFKTLRTMASGFGSR